TLAGVLEGLTRMALGRHWPLDIVAALPIGLVVALIVGRAVIALSVLADPAGQH
ncbi:MAG: phosphatase PAP2 family protein, partial [Acidimicrobiales bacterium]|nr:phosphatase PAP2 family protein [Acidimicrobiales bacterium]